MRDFSFSSSGVSLVGVLLGSILLCLFALPHAAWGFYQGKTIRIIWPFDPASGGAIRARVFARHLPKWIPGQPSVIVQFMPGGGGLVAANHAFVVAKSDGLTVLHFPASTLMHSFVSPDRVHYDIRKVPVIWTEPDNWVTIIDPKTAQVKSIKDLLRPGVRVAVGGTGVSTARSLRPKLGMELLGVDHTWVTGYGGAGPLQVALERGEIHSYETPLVIWPQLAPLEKQGRVMMLWQNGFVRPDGSFERSSFVPDVPTLDELVPREKKNGRIWEAYKALVVVQSFQSSIGLHPAVPADHVRTLTQAFKAMTGDPTYRQDYERALMSSGDAYVGTEADTLVKAGIKMIEGFRDGVQFLRELGK